MLAGGLIGELVFCIALVSMLPAHTAGEGLDWPRLVLGTLHGLAVLVGVEIVFTLDEISPTWLGTGFMLTNWLAMGMLAFVVAMLFPARPPGGSLVPMLEVTFGPFTGAMVWGLAIMPEAFSLGQPDTWWLPMVMLGFHYTILSSILMIGLIFLRVSTMTRALSWGEDGFPLTIFAIVISSWVAQFVWMAWSQTELLLGEGVEGVVLGVLMSLLGVWRIFSRSQAGVSDLSDKVARTARS